LLCVLKSFDSSLNSMIYGNMKILQNAKTKFFEIWRQNSTKNAWNSRYNFVRFRFRQNNGCFLFFCLQKTLFIVNKITSVFNFMGGDPGLTNNSLFQKLITNFLTNIKHKIIMYEKYYTKYGPILLIIIK